MQCLGVVPSNPSPRNGEWFQPKEKTACLLHPFGRSVQKNDNNYQLRERRVTNKHNIEQPPLFKSNAQVLIAMMCAKISPIVNTWKQWTKAPPKHRKLLEGPLEFPHWEVCDPYSGLYAMYCSRMCIHIRTTLPVDSNMPENRRVVLM